MHSARFAILIGPILAGALAVGAGLALGSAKGDPVVAQPGSTYHMVGRLTIDPETTHLAGNWTISLDQPETETVTYWLNANYEGVAVTGAHVVASRVEPAGPPGVQAITVELVAAGDEPRRFSIDYSGILFPQPMENQINSISPEKVEFTVDSFWQPFDARFSERVTGDIEIAIPGDWTPVTTGQAERVGDGIQILFARAMLDFPITLLSEFRDIQTENYRILDTRPGDLDIRALADTAGFCTGYLNDRFGEREVLPQASIVLHDRPSSGYARGTLIALSETGGGDGPDTTKFVCHEFAHFWSQNGVPITVENWLNESFAEFIGLMAVRERFGEAAFDAVMTSWQGRLDTMGDLPSIWIPDDLSRRPHAINYIKGPLALGALERRIGREAFAEFVRRYMVQRIGTTPELLEMLGDVAGEDERAWFEARLGE